MTHSRASQIAAGAAMMLVLVHSQRASANVASQLDYFREAGAAHCPDETELRQAISSRLGYDPFIEWSPRRVVAEIAVNGSRLAAIIRLVENGGIVQSRSELSADKDECAELIAAVGLAIAIHLDPDSATRVGRGEPAQSEPAGTPQPTKSEAPALDRMAAAVPPTPETPSRKRGSTAPAPNPSLPLIPAVRLGSTVFQGMQPRTTYALKAGASLLYGALRATTEILADLPASEQYARGGIRSHALSAALLPCAAYRWIAGCAEVMADVVWAQGVDVAVPEKATLWNLAAGARLEATLELTRAWAAVADVDLLRNLTPTALRLQQTPVWQSPAYRYALGLAVEMRFP